MHHRARLITLGLITATAGSGCATYMLPASHLETPEARGKPNSGRVELFAIQMGTDLLGDAEYVTFEPDEETKVADPPVYRTGQALAGAFGFVMGLDEKIDVGVRIPAQAPLALRFKYQLSGKPETEAAKGNFSTAIAASPGILLGENEGRTTTFFSGDIAFIAGYRVRDRHLLILTPFFNFGSISGVPTTVAQSTETTPTTTTGGANASTGPGASASATQYGGALGYQYDIDALIFRTEVAYALGKVGTPEINGVFVGALLGMRF